MKFNAEEATKAEDNSMGKIHNMIKFMGKNLQRNNDVYGTIALTVDEFNPTVEEFFLFSTIMALENGPSPLSDTYKLLDSIAELIPDFKEQLSDGIKKYKAKHSTNSDDSNDDLLNQLQQAILQERYEDANRIKNQIENGQ